MPKPPLDPSIIDRAPLADNATAPQAADYIGQLETLVFTLQAELDESQAEVVRLAASETFEQVRTKMMKPYADKVFRFVTWYCVAVGLMLLAAGFAQWTHFRLSDAILGIIAGSTAVAVIGLIGMVLGGLFGSTKTGA